MIIKYVPAPPSKKRLEELTEILAQDESLSTDSKLWTYEQVIHYAVMKLYQERTGKNH